MWASAEGKPYNHGSPFYWAIKEGLIIPEYSTQIGIRGPLYSRTILDWPKSQGLRIIMGQELHERGITHVAEEVVTRTGNKPVYVTFDIDFLDASCAPGTGTPEIEGFTTWEALSLMRHICPRLDCVGMDLVEILPDKDLSGINSLQLKMIRGGAAVANAGEWVVFPSFGAPLWVKQSMPSHATVLVAPGAHKEKVLLGGLLYGLEEAHCVRAARLRDANPKNIQFEVKIKEAKTSE